MNAGKRFRPLAYWRPTALNLYAALPAGLKQCPLTNKLLKRFLDRRFFTDIRYRTRLLLFPSFAANLLYAAMQLTLGICYRSIWSGALAVYYAMLAVMRVQLLKPIKSAAQGDLVFTELRRFHLCGVVLLCMTPIFASIMILVVHKNSGAHYPPFTIAVMTIYTACMMVASILRLARSNDRRYPTLVAAKIVSLVAALMSALSLITALVAGVGDESHDALRLGLVGTASGAICVIVLSIALYMLTYAARKRKLLEKNKKGAVISNSLNKPPV